MSLKCHLLLHVSASRGRHQATIKWRSHYTAWACASLLTCHFMSPRLRIYARTFFKLFVCCGVHIVFLVCGFPGPLCLILVLVRKIVRYSNISAQRCKDSNSLNLSEWIQPAEIVTKLEVKHNIERECLSAYVPGCVFHHISFPKLLKRFRLFFK
jgi:hypothetical protein